ncbi:MAG: hypothetical protein ACLPYS_05435 [Vulcanimicrobiaceae bacterium]
MRVIHGRPSRQPGQTVAVVGWTICTAVLMIWLFLLYSAVAR